MTKFIYTKFLRGVMEIIRRHDVTVTGIKSGRHHVFRCQHGQRKFALHVSSSPTNMDLALAGVERDLRRQLRGEDHE